MAEARLPRVEMLWESLDPGDALAERFGLEDAASAARWLASTLDEHWGMRVDACERIVISDRNALAWLSTAAGSLVLKWSVAPERFARLARIARLTQWLGDRGLPVSRPLPCLDGRPQVEADGFSMGLQRVIEGDLLDVGDDEQVRAAGAVLARLHHALARYPDADRVVPPTDPPAPLADRLDDWLDDWLETRGEQVPVATRDVLRARAARAPDDVLATQLVHGDFRSSNVLCRGPEVVAVIDFEETRVDHCLDEVARSAVMLGTRFRGWGPVSAEVHARFLAGYQSVRRLTPAESAWWEVLVLWHAWALVPPAEDPTGWRRAALAQQARLTRGQSPG